LRLLGPQLLLPLLLRLLRLGPLLLRMLGRLLLRLLGLLLTRLLGLGLLPPLLLGLGWRRLLLGTCQSHMSDDKVH
jgi:hypothetical protein